MTNPLLSAIVNGDDARLASLVDDGHKVNAPIATVLAFTTALIAAVRHGRIAMVQLLLDAGARVDACDSYGQTASHYAASGGHTAIAELLLARGANVGLRDLKGQSAFYTATVASSDAVAIAMIKAGAVAPSELDLLCRAAGMSVAVAKLLAQRGYNVAQLRTADGGTACHVAAQRADDVGCSRT